MENRRRNAGEEYRKRVLVPEIRDGKRCKSCFEPITDETKWFKGEQLCDDCKKLVKNDV